MIINKWKAILLIFRISKNNIIIDGKKDMLGGFMDPNISMTNDDL